MEPLQAKLVAAGTGSLLTAITSKHKPFHCRSGWECLCLPPPLCYICISSLWHGLLLIVTPFDVVKTRLQTQPPKPKSRQLFARPPSNACCQPNNIACVRGMSHLAISALSRSEVVCVWDHGVWRQERVNGFYDAVKHVVRAEGLRGLWKGAGTTMFALNNSYAFRIRGLTDFLPCSLIGVPSSTCYMVTYDHLLHSVFPLFFTPSPLTPLFAGITARTFITSVASPLELVRTNLQSTPSSSSNPNTLRSVISSIANLARKQGPASLWKGLGATLWRDVPFSGLYWANYEGFKSRFNRNGREGAPVAFASGAMSGIIAALFTSPFDVLKTRRQALIMSTPSHTTSTIPLLKHMVQTEGYSSLYAGIGPRMAKIAPACGMMIACYEVRIFLFSALDTC